MKQLKPVPQDKIFYVYEGGTINSLYQLADSLASMPAKSFNHHVTPTRNDFANWVRDVIQDSVLAQRISSQKSKALMEKTVRERIHELEEQHMPAHASKNIIRKGIFDFIIGLIVGVVAGLILASVL